MKINLYYYSNSELVNFYFYLIGNRGGGIL